MTENDTSGQITLTKPVMAICALFLMTPSAIPLYFVWGESDGKVVVFLVVLSFTILLVNSVLLAVLYRWFRKVLTT